MSRTGGRWPVSSCGLSWRAETERQKAQGRLGSNPNYPIESLAHICLNAIVIKAGALLWEDR
jgi:hypothetical protein